jgi:hypothetical protein
MMIAFSAMFKSLLCLDDSHKECNPPSDMRHSRPKREPGSDGRAFYVQNTSSAWHDSGKCWAYWITEHRSL